MKCNFCGQDHKKAAACMGAQGGRAPKNSAVQRANVLKRWEKYRSKKS
jgi:hypothetical protein